MMFKRILIANRGEIAIRIMRACREMGIQSISVFSEADASACHVRYSDLAYPIGPAPSTESYLCIDKIINVAKQSRADAIHPGYGFLAENSEFAQCVQEAGLAFIGPNPDTIKLLGDKMTARKTMIKAGVPVEDARYILPPAFYTHIAISMNARTLRHFFELRCAPEAQWEIRELANKMLDICYEKYPVLFEDIHETYREERILSKDS